MHECNYCHRNLAEATELHAMYGLLFCSKECAVDYFTNNYYIKNAHDLAEEDYASAAEIIGKEILQ